MTGHGVAYASSVLQPALTARSRRYVIAACSAALAFGVLLPFKPWAAVAWLVAIPLAFAAPVGALTMIIAITVLVPWDLQNTLKVIGEPGHPGLLVVDVLMLLGLLRVGWLVVRGRLEVDLPLLMGTIAAVVCTAALFRGIATGAEVSAAGTEVRRVLLGLGTFVLAWPLMRNRSARLHLAWVLMGIGLASGLWGLAQWVFSVGFTSSADVGVRGGLASGQLQGGLYVYPVAVALAWAALVVGQVRNVAAKCLLAVILLLNAVCVLLTFERTLWVATAVACVFVVVTSGVGALLPAVRWAWIGVVLLVGAAVIAPAHVRTALERWALLGKVGSDSSFTHRLVESRVVTEAITARPVMGSGFGATITWGVPNTFPTTTTPFADMGYLWLAWKIGIPAAVIVVLLLGRAVLRRSPSEDTAEWHALRKGSQASLLALLLIGLTFAPFNALGITAAMGLLVAICYSGVDPPAVPSPVRWQGINGSRLDG
jgi:O-Antigen ligase